MEVSTETIVYLGGVAVTIVAGWVTFKHEIRQLWREFSQLKKWKDEHDKWSIERREEIQQNIAELRTSLLVREEQYKEILRRLDSIDQKMGGHNA